MRGLFQFALFLAIVFFIVGEFFGGWYLGVLPQTPAYVYKKSHTATVTRRTLDDSAEFPYSISGKLRDGSLTVEVVYERPVSYQGRTSTPIAPQTQYEETFRAGQTIRVSDSIRRGWGIYQVRLIFEDATGQVKVDVPASNDL